MYKISLNSKGRKIIYDTETGKIISKKKLSEKENISINEINYTIKNEPDFLNSLTEGKYKIPEYKICVNRISYKKKNGKVTNSTQVRIFNNKTGKYESVKSVAEKRGVTEIEVIYYAQSMPEFFNEQQDFSGFEVFLSHNNLDELKGFKLYYFGGGESDKFEPFENKVLELVQQYGYPIMSCLEFSISKKDKSVYFSSKEFTQDAKSKFLYKRGQREFILLSSQ